MLPARLPGAPRGGRDRGQALIDRLGLRDVAGLAPHQLSGGEQQRFALARALVGDPLLLLADEPVGNLDADSGVVVLDLLRAIADDGRGVLMVTHQAEATARADRILRLEDGVLSDARSSGPPLLDHAGP
jgi:ABC-type lipoprotein export system ATPase subunit